MWGEFCETYAPSLECSLEDIIRNDINKYKEEYDKATNDQDRAYANGKIFALQELLKRI